MNIKNKVKKFFDKKQNDFWIKKYFLNQLTRDGFEEIFSGFTDEGKKSDNYAGTVFAALDVYGLYFSKAKFRIYQKTKEGVQEVKDPRYTILFDRPNAYQGWLEIKHRIGVHLGLFGNSYLYKIRDGKGRIIGYQHLLPSAMKRKKEENSKNLFDYYEYADVKIPKRDIIDFRYPNPYSEIEGYPIISSILDTIEVNKLQVKYSKKALEKGGYLGLTFATDQELSKTSFEKLRDELEKRFGGDENAFRVALLTSGLKPVAPPYSPKDMEFGTNKNLTREEILSAFKVPKILLGIGESINRATAEASIYTFTSGVIDPLLSMIDDVLTRDFALEFSPDFFIEHDILSPKDQQGQLEYYSRGLKEGWLTINEVRESEGLNKLQGKLADVPTINMGGALVNVDTALQIDTGVPNGN